MPRSLQAQSFQHNTIVAGGSRYEQRGCHSGASCATSLEKLGLHSRHSWPMELEPYYQRHVQQRASSNYCSLVSSTSSINAFRFLRTINCRRQGSTIDHVMIMQKCDFFFGCPGKLWRHFLSFRAWQWFLENCAAGRTRCHLVTKVTVRMAKAPRCNSTQTDKDRDKNGGGEWRKETTNFRA